MNPRISPSHSQRTNLYRNISKPGGSPPSERAQRSGSPARSPSQNSPTSSTAPALGDDLSREERAMIHEQFPPVPETTMRIYGRDRGGRQIQPGTLGRRIDLQG